MTPNNTNSNVSFPYALDSNGNQIWANDAQKGAIYHCPYCNCKMFRKDSSKGTPFFSRYVAVEHEDEVCRRIEKTGKYHSFKSSDTPTDFITKLIRPSVSKSSATTTSAHNNDSTPTTTIETDASPKAIPFTSLKQICEYIREGFNPNEKIGDYILSDFFIYYSWFPRIFPTPSKAILGSRIIYARSLFYDDDSFSLGFQVFQNSNNSNYTIRFKVDFNSRKLYFDYKRNLIKPVLNADGSQDYIWKDAIIASTNWEPLKPHKPCTPHCPAKNCNDCNLFRTDFFSSKQLYIVPPKDTNK